MKRTRVQSITSITASDEPQAHSHTSKLPALEPAAYDGRASGGVICNLPPHTPEVFADSTSYETHYLAEHTHRCTECHRNLPSAHFLELHISEAHDPIVAVRKTRGEKIYACFVEDCDKICSDWKKRRRHLVDKHHYPRNYDFFVIIDGIDGRQSLLRTDIDENGHRYTSEGTGIKDDRGSADQQLNIQASDRETSVGIGPSSSTEIPSTDDGVNGIAARLAALQMVPRSIRFGRKGASGLARS